MIAHRLGTAATLTACLLLVFAACGNDPTAGSSGSPPEPVSCRAVIPAEVISGLGWDSDVVAAEGSGGCDWAGPQGFIVMLSRAESLESACAELERTPGDRDGYDAAVLVPGSDADACAYFRTTDIGPSKLMLNATDGTVVGIDVLALVPTPPEDVEAALVALTEHAADVP